MKPVEEEQPEEEVKPVEEEQPEEEVKPVEVDTFYTDYTEDK